MSFVSATVDISDVETGLKAMERRAHQLGPAFAEIKNAMKIDQRNHREAQEGPDGGWAPRAESTLAASASHHKGKVLPRRTLGKLPTAVLYKALPYATTGESRIPWSLSQQDGDSVGHGSRLPARTFLWISDELLAFAENAIGKRTIAAWEGR